MTASATAHGSTPSLHGDPTRRVRVDTTAMEWQPSPSPSVLRKRLHLVGGAESGQVTSVVRYLPGARFPAHDHPDGEEILVLEGVFSDEHGDWPAGTYLSNPEGFRHAPFSRDGCVLFVKLRQLAGAHRRHVAVQTRDLAWEPGERPGTSVRTLYVGASDDPAYRDATRLERLEPGAPPTRVAYPEGVEIFVLAGVLEDEHGAHPVGTWLRLPERSEHAPFSTRGCELYVKTGGLPTLRHDPAT